MAPSHEARMLYVDGRLKELGAERVRKAQEVAAEGESDLISGALLLAISLRESGCRNVLGDQGHARGHMQIHDRFHEGWLRSVPGCNASATIAGHTRQCWIPVAGKTAMDAGCCPTFEDGCRGAVLILRGYITQGRGLYRDSVALSAAVAAYNCGFAAVRRAISAGDVDLHTTGRNYSTDCLRRRSEVNAWLRAHPGWRAGGSS
ncbi:MAG: hypothetical protein WKF96_22065 [Solirubrobacteraceae bacterium]